MTQKNGDSYYRGLNAGEWRGKIGAKVEDIEEKIEEMKKDWKEDIKNLNNCLQNSTKRVHKLEIKVAEIGIISGLVGLGIGYAIYQIIASVI